MPARDLDCSFAIDAWSIPASGSWGILAHLVIPIGSSRKVDVELASPTQASDGPFESWGQPGQPRLLTQVSPSLLLFDPSGQMVSDQTTSDRLTPDRLAPDRSASVRSVPARLAP